METRRGVRLQMVCYSAAYVGVVLSCLLVELAMAIPIPRRLYASIALGAGLLAAGMSHLPKMRLYIWCVLCVPLLVLCITPWTPRKSFIRVLDRVQTGMSPEEVDKILSAYLQGTGWPGCPDDLASDGGAKLKFYRHADGGPFGSDWGIVEFLDGSVVSVRFSAD